MRAAALVRSAADRTLVVENVACGNFPHAQVVGLSVLQEADGIAAVKGGDFHWKVLSKELSKVRTSGSTSKRRARLAYRQVMLASYGS